MPATHVRMMQPALMGPVEDTSASAQLAMRAPIVKMVNMKQTRPGIMALLLSFSANTDMFCKVDSIDNI